MLATVCEAASGKAEVVGAAVAGVVAEPADGADDEPADEQRHRRPGG